MSPDFLRNKKSRSFERLFLPAKKERYAGPNFSATPFMQ
jgi:hypothetical protein